RARVQQRHVRTNAERLPHHRDVAPPRRRPAGGPPRKRRAALPVARETRVEQRDLGPGPAGLRGERLAHPRRRQMLDGDENEPRVAAVPVRYGRKPRSKFAVVQKLAGLPPSSASTFARMSACVMLTKCLSTVPYTSRKSVDRYCTADCL